MSLRLGSAVAVALVMGAAEASAFDFIFLDSASQYVGTVAVNSYLDPECETDDANEACDENDACDERDAGDADRTGDMNTDAVGEEAACPPDGEESDQEIIPEAEKRPRAE